MPSANSHKVCALLLQICTHSDFELLVLILIFGNCISLASYDPMNHDSDRNQIIENVGEQSSPECLGSATMLHSCLQYDKHQQKFAG